MKKLYPLLSVLFLIYWGCEEEDVIIEKEKFESLQFAKEKWKTKNITSYTINLSVNCFCLPYQPIVIKVDDDIIAEINGDSVTQFQLENDYWYANTVDDLFLFIEQSLAQEPYQKILLFNSSYGYPEEIFFDFEEMVADEEIGYIITSFKID